MKKLIISLIIGMIIGSLIGYEIGSQNTFEQCAEKTLNRLKILNNL